MILVVNLNPSLDKIYTLDNLPYGEASRAKTVQNTAGGKGTHVANVITALGHPATVVGFLGGYVGQYIRHVLDERRIVHHCTTIEGETRSCVNIATSDGKQTEVLEPGPTITEGERDEFLAQYDVELKRSDIVVASGSLPKGLGHDFYNELIRRAKEQGKPFLLDTSGSALSKGVEAVPYFIKPNESEVEVLTGHKLTKTEEAVQVLHELEGRGIAMPTLSLGKRGALLAHEGKVFRAVPPTIEQVINAVGSGDSFVAGLAVALDRGASPEEALRLAAACGTANVLEAESGVVDPEKVAAIEKEVQITIV